MKIISTIEARMTSSRLPGKPMLKASGQTMMEHLIKRLQKVKSIDTIILATTINETDDILADHCKDMGLEVFRGSEDDVMGRVIGAAEMLDADIIVEITGDCPIIDPSLIEQTIQIYKNNSVDYVSNCNVRSYPDGMDVQVFSLDVLKKSGNMTSDPLDREHVTLHIRNNPNLFSHINIVAPPEQFWPDLGVTLDEENDYKLIKTIINNFDRNYLFSCSEIISFLKNNRDLLKINADIKRKGDT